MGKEERPSKLEQTRRKLTSLRNHSQRQEPASSSQNREPASSSSLHITVTPAQTGWSILKGILEVVRDASDLCLPLKASLVGIVAIMDSVERVKDIQADFEDVAHRIGRLQHIFERYSTNSMPDAAHQRLEGVSRALDLAQSAIYVKTGRNIGRRMLESLGDVEAVVKAFKYVATLVEDFNVDTLMQVEDNTYKIQKRIEELANHNTINELQYVRGVDYSSQKSEGCMPNTRVSVLGEILAWSMDQSAPRIFWLSGMAGIGKSAIAWTFCDILHSNGLLGGSFFCTRTGATERSDAQRIIPTLARQLARSNMRYKFSLINLLEFDPDVGHKPVRTQCRRLIRDQRSVISDGRELPIVFVIDALDDCTEEEDTTQLLDELVSLAASPNLPVKFFLSSRPEPYIRQRFEVTSSLHRVTRLHDIELDIVGPDIEFYISNRLAQIQQSQPATPFPPQWPARSDVWSLARAADKLFIYAFTAVEYVRQDPVHRLKTLQVNSAGRPLHKKTDAIYESILSDVANLDKYEPHEVDLVRKILSTIPALETPITVSSLGDILELSTHRIRMTLDRLHAVVYVPQTDDVGIISFFHSSFGDFVRTQDRVPRALFVEPQEVHRTLALACLRIMQSQLLHFNISDCSSSYLPTDEQELATIHPSVLYACLNWAVHLISSGPLGIQSLLSLADEAFCEQFLFWVEALVASGNGPRALEIIETVLSELTDQKYSSSALLAHLHDALFFLQAEQDVIEHSLPHLYLSALPSVDPASFIAKKFWPLFASTPVVVPHGRLAWTRERTDIPASMQHSMVYQAGHNSAVQSVTFSPDGLRILSGSYDATIRVWDASSGTQILLPLAENVHRVSSIVISPDGSTIFSGSSDGMLRAWCAHTGALKAEFGREHRGHITTIALSADGHRLVSGSHDRTVRIWNAHTGADLLGALIAHRDAVTSVALSTDNAFAASGSLDAKICIWDTATGGLRRVLAAMDMGAVYGVAFAPKDARLASASFDTANAVRIWDVRTGMQTMVPLSDDEAGPARSVAFSPDGARVAAGFFDNTIRVWDARTGEDYTSPLEGHSGPVCAVAFSPCGARLVSGSFDESVRVWELGDVYALSMRSIEVDQPVLAPNDNGWVEGLDGALLYHIRDEFRTQSLHLSMPVSRCSLLIALHGIRIDFTEYTAHGQSWTKCYVGSRTESSTPRTVHDAHSVHLDSK